jgi:hypothetical protein
MEELATLKGPAKGPVKEPVKAMHSETPMGRMW